MGHVTIGEPLFEFAAAARTTDLLNLPHRFHRPIDILDDKACLSFNNYLGDRTARETDYWRAAGKRFNLLLLRRDGRLEFGSGALSGTH